MLEGKEKVVQVEHNCSPMPTVSVCVMTYNHEKHIRQCLDSILEQKCTFDFEIILGEDNSSDNTRKICLEYAQKFPDKIRLFLHDRDNVIYINGQATGRYNFIYCLEQTKGKYIAICEGDDFWTNPHKLQKQVDFLEIHQDYAVCFHNVDLQIESDGEVKTKFFEHDAKDTSTIYDLAKRNMIHTAAVMFKKQGIPYELLFESSVGDYIMHMYNAQFGKIKYLDESMAVYRIHPKGYWSLMKIQKQLQSIKLYLKVLRKFFSGKNNLVYLILTLRYWRISLVIAYQKLKAKLRS